MDLRKASILVFTSKILSTIVGFFAIVVFSRLLGASALGIYYPFIALLGILGIPADIGLRNAVEKRISEGTDENIYFGSFLSLKVLPLIFISLIIYVLREYINIYLGGDFAILLIIALIARQFGTIPHSILNGELRVGETALIRLIQSMGWLTFGYLLYLQDYGVYALIYGHIIGSILMAIIGWWKLSVPIGFPSLKHAKSLFDFGKFAAVTTVGGFVYSWMDVAILTAFVALEITATRASIGAYENAWRMSLVVSLLGRSVSMVIFPQISQWDAEDAIDRIEEIIPIAVLLSLLVAIPGFVGTLILSNEMLRIVYGPEFVIASTALIILMGEKILQSIQVILSRSLRGLDHPDLAAYATLVTIMMNFILNIILIFYFGIIGAAIATGTAIGINTTLHIYYLNQYLDLNFPYYKLGWCIISSTIMGVSVSLVYVVFEIQTTIQLTIIIVFGAIIYSASLISYTPLREQFLSISRNILANVLD
jgi:O-antigen/teichoic acid export membrane protein